jgi:hypothetical protein
MLKRLMTPNAIRTKKMRTDVVRLFMEAFLEAHCLRRTAQVPPNSSLSCLVGFDSLSMRSAAYRIVIAEGAIAKASGHAGWRAWAARLAAYRPHDGLRA